MYEVKLEQFSGPLEKLLELIEEKRLEITAIGLAAVTADFLDYLRSLTETKHPTVLADFVVIASKLLLIKSKALLPELNLTPEEEKDIRNLEDRLKIYREFKTISVQIGNLWQQQRFSQSRSFLMGMPPVFYPPKNLALADLEVIVQKILAELQRLAPEKQTIKNTVISIEAKIKELLERLRGQTASSFHHLAKAKPRLEVIALFLAILHLLRDRLIETEQDNQFSDIIIKNYE